MEVNYYVFIVTSVEWEPFSTGDQIARTLAANSVWLASSTTPFRRAYKAGDQVLFYVAGAKARFFIGNATVAGVTSNNLPEDDKIAQKLGLDGFVERIPLRDVMIWESTVPIKPLVESLLFIKDKVNYGLNLRQAAARIPSADYDLILDKSKEVSSP